MLLPLAVGLLDSHGHDMRLTSVKDGTSLHNLTSVDGDYTTTAVLHVDKVQHKLRFNSIILGYNSPDITVYSSLLVPHSIERFLLKLQ